MSSGDSSAVRCPACGASYRWKPELAGKKVKCRCGGVVAVPAQMAVEAAAGVPAGTKSFQNKLGEKFGVAGGLVYWARPDSGLGNDVSEPALARASAVTFRCKELHELRQHENAERAVGLVIKKGIRPTDVESTEIDTHDPAIQQAFVQAIVEEMRPTRPVRQSSFAMEILGPIIVAVVIALIGGLVVSAALEPAGSTRQASTRMGKARGIENIVNGIADALGPAVSMLLFGALLLACVGWAVMLYRRRHHVVRWRLV